MCLLTMWATEVTELLRFSILEENKNCLETSAEIFNFQREPVNCYCFVYLSPFRISFK